MFAVFGVALILALLVVALISLLGLTGFMRLTALWLLRRAEAIDSWRERHNAQTRTELVALVQE